MKYRSRSNPGEDPLASVIVELEIPDNAFEFDSGSKVRYTGDILISFDESVDIEGFIFEVDGSGIVDIGYIEIDDQKERITQKINIIKDRASPTTLRIHWELGGDMWGPLNFSIPTYQEMKIADQLIYGSADKKAIDNVLEMYAKDSVYDAVFSLRDSIRQWISINENFQMLNTAARLSTEIKDALNSQKTEWFIAAQLSDPNGQGNFDISSRTEVEQVVSTCNNLRHIPNINMYHIIGRAIQIIHREGDMRAFWLFEKRYNVARDDWGDILWEEQYTALLARSFLEEDFSRARSIISNWIGDPGTSEYIDKKIDEAEEQEGEEALESWKLSLAKAAPVSDRSLLFVSCRYFESFLDQREDNLPIYIIEQLYKTLADLRKGLGQIDRARTARHQYHQTRGHMLRNEDNYEEACEEFECALETALEEASDQGSTTYTSPEWALYWLFHTRAERAVVLEEFQTGIEYVAEGKSMIRALNEVQNEGTRGYCLNRLEAFRYELLGDQKLSKGQLETAKQNYGKAIHEYQTVEMDDRASYLIRRRSLITASLAEQKGDFSAAKNAHLNAAKTAQSEVFRSFNEARAGICEAKGAILNNELDRAADIIGEHIDRENIAGVEARHLNLLLKVLRSFGDGDVLDIAEVFNQLEDLRDIGQVSGEFPFEYGHEYRPAFANILAAQRLKKLDVDPILLDELIEISLRNVLAPEQAQRTIQEWGIDDIGLIERWKFNFPTHIVRRFQEIEAAEVNTRDNYSDQALALLRLLEQTLEFAADYHGSNKIGPDWQEKYSRNDEGLLSFESLRNFLNTNEMDDCVWTERVTDLIDEDMIDCTDLIDARNAISHDRRSMINESEYEEVKDRVETIFAMMSSDIPILGEIESEHELGAYIFNPHWENVRKWCYLRVEGDLNMDTVYYLPPGSLRNDSVAHLEREEIIRCTAERVIENLKRYTGRNEKENA